jgi:hypothetical protein
MSRFTTATLSCALMLVILAACSDDGSGDGQTASTTPFQFVAGTWSVALSPRSTNCLGDVYYPQEVWAVTTYLASVSAQVLPDPSSAPQPAAAASSAAAATSTAEEVEASVLQATPLNYSGLIDKTLHWSASLEQDSATQDGCLDRTTTLLDIQFTPTGQFAGTRSLFHEYAGGGECGGSCRTIFDLEGAMKKQ